MSTTTTSTLPVRGTRPVLRHSSLSGGSFINDHQQYKPAHPTAGSPSNGDILGTQGELAPHLDAPLNGNGNGNSVNHSETRIKDSGVVHTIFKNSHSLLPADTPKLVATIFYKSSNPVHPPVHPDASSLNGASLDKRPAAEVVPGSAPSLDLDQIPREPPAQEPEPLDHLYGPYVSQLCLTNFLQIMEELSNPYQRMSTSHRCLDHEDQPRIVEVTMRPPPSSEYLTFDDLRKHESIWRFEREWNVEVVLQQESIFRRYKRLAVFDMDSTLIKEEVIDEIARYIGVEKEVSEITSRAMNGELDFTESLKARVKLLKGVNEDVFEKLKSVITIAPGARELCRALHRLGYKTAVLSGGFQPLADWLAGQLGLDYAFANQLVVDPATKTLTGELSPDYPIVNAAEKRSRLRSIAAENDIKIVQTIAVGDGANDLLMLHEAGLGVAWRAKSKVQLEAPTRLNGESLVDILYLMGIGEAEIKELTNA